MAVQQRLLIAHYYDEHLAPDDDMSESWLQDKLSKYLVQVLDWLFRAESWLVARNLAIYRSREFMERPLVPDVAVFIGVPVDPDQEHDIRSWTVELPESPPPSVVIEVLSKDTWQKDVEDNPPKYGILGVSEDYCYNPRPRQRHRLWGWRYVEGSPREILPDNKGRIWSEMLQSWLVPDRRLLRLYDLDGKLRPTGEEAERAARERERREKERERLAKERAEHEKEAERMARERAEHEKEAERMARERAEHEKEAERVARERAEHEKEAERVARERAEHEKEVERVARERAEREMEAERMAKERAWRALRKLGIDPENLPPDA